MLKTKKKTSETVHHVRWICSEFVWWSTRKRPTSARPLWKCFESALRVHLRRRLLAEDGCLHSSVSKLLQPLLVRRSAVKKKKKRRADQTGTERRQHKQQHDICCIHLVKSSQRKHLELWNYPIGFTAASFSRRLQLEWGDCRREPPPPPPSASSRPPRPCTPSLWQTLISSQP